MNFERWLQLMEAWGFGANRGCFESLLAAYSSKGRHYHTAEHVSACLRHLDGCLAKLQYPREVEFALWFHDAIYEPLSGSNEKESANWAVSFLSEHGATEAEVARVHRLIMVTEHNAPTQTSDEAVLVDIDLSILGASSVVYDIFEAGVRQEYKVIPSFMYRKKRAEVLRGFLERDKIYTSGCFPPEVERQAKKNLSNAVAVLEGRT